MEVYILSIGTSQAGLADRASPANATRLDLADVPRRANVCYCGLSPTPHVGCEPTCSVVWKPERSRHGSADIPQWPGSPALPSKNAASDTGNPDDSEDPPDP